MRKLLIIIYLIFAILSLLGEIFTNFRETTTSFQSLNFKEHFIVRNLYLDDYYDNTTRGGTSNYEFFGHFKNGEKNSVFLAGNGPKYMREYRKYDKEDNIYYEVWYNEDTGKIFFKTSDEVGVYRNGFYIIVLWIFIIPAIYYLIKIRKKK